MEQDRFGDLCFLDPPIDRAGCIGHRRRGGERLFQIGQCHDQERARPASRVDDLDPLQSRPIRAGRLARRLARLRQAGIRLPPRQQWVDHLLDDPPHYPLGRIINAVALALGDIGQRRPILGVGLQLLQFDDRLFEDVAQRIEPDRVLRVALAGEIVSAGEVEQRRLVFVQLGFVLPLPKAHEQVVGQLQSVKRGIIAEQSTVELVDLLPGGAQLAALVHHPEDLFQPPPDLVAFGLQELVPALPFQLFAERARRKADAPAHVLGEHDEDQAIEQLLPQPDRAAAGHAQPLALQRDMVDQDLAISAVIGVERVFEPLLDEALLFDQPLQPGAAGFAQQHVGLEQVREQEAVEPRLLVRADQRLRVEQVAALDLEAEVAVGEAVPPVQAELVHVGDDRIARLHRLVAEHAPPGVPQIVLGLHHRRSGVALARLWGVEAGSDVLELAHDLRDASRRAVRVHAEPAQRQVGLAPMAALPGPGDRELLPQLEPVTLTGIAIAPQLDEEALHERAFCLRLAHQLAPRPTGQPLAQAVVGAGGLVVLILIGQLGPEELAVEQRLETVGCHGAPSGFSRSEIAVQR